MRFQGVQPGDVLELPAKRALPEPLARGRDPDMPAQIAVVTHRWWDPVDRREYVGLAWMRIDGGHGEPTMKHTIRGLAHVGWRYAQADYRALARAIGAGEVEFIRGRRG